MLVTGIQLSAAAGASCTMDPGHKARDDNVGRVGWSMLELAVLAAVVFAGYADASGWSVPAGAVALTVASWWRKVRLLRQHPRVPFSSKMTTYLVVSIVINVGFAVAGYIAGHALRRWLGN